MDKLMIKQIASLKAQLRAPPAPAPAGTLMRALAAAPEQPVPPRYAAKPRPKNAHANYRDFVFTPTMRNCSNCNERHLDRDCPNRPPPKPLRAPATAASAGTADPPCWRVGFPVCCFPPCGVFPPRCAGAVPPCGLLTRSVALAFMGPTVRPSGVGEPDLGWQQGGRRGRAAATHSTTPPETETLADVQASQRHPQAARSAHRDRPLSPRGRRPPSNRPPQCRRRHSPRYR